jgi:1-phosphatidylinositol phosphodiesterase
MSILHNVLPQRGKFPHPGWDAILRWRTLIFFLLLCGFLIPLWTIKYPLNIASLAHLSISSLAAKYNDYHSPYSFDASHNSAPRWMASLHSSRNLTSLSIPGTHDTMTNALNGALFQCQNTPLSIQLLAGIRYFDIRARLNNNELLIYHQDSYTNYTYVDVLTTFFSFLKENPGEVILMRLKEELRPINSTIDFLTAFNYYRLHSSLTAQGCGAHFWIPPTPGPTSIPTLGELRGKILILQNFGPEPAEYGIKWESPILAIEDLYDIPDLYYGLDEKWEAIEEALVAAGNETKEEDGDGKLYISHLSASVGVLPIEAAAGTRNGSVVGLNDRTGEWLREGNGGGTGVVIIDFPGKDLIQAILKRNKT